MTVRRGSLVALVAGLALAAVPGNSVAAPAANECNGIPRCIPIAGPWVAVPAHGEALFSLSCPGGGVVAGTDGLGSTLDVRGYFDGILGSPVAFGRTTHNQALFRAVSAHHRPGYFKPFIGCIPAPSSVAEHDLDRGLADRAAARLRGAKREREPRLPAHDHALVPRR